VADPEKTRGGPGIVALIVEAGGEEQTWSIAAWPPEKGTTPTPVRRNDTY
jgi:hypothetical protein